MSEPSNRWQVWIRQMCILACILYINTYGILSKCLFPKSAIIRVYMGLRFLLLHFQGPVQTNVQSAKGIFS